MKHGVLVVTDSGTTYAKRAFCDRMAAEGNGRWIGESKFKLFPYQPEHDGTKGHWVTRHSGERSDLGIKTPELGVKQFDRGITKN